MGREEQKWFQVSLRLTGDSLPVNEIESKLGIVPSFIGTKGEHIRNNPRYAKYDTHLWGWKFTTDSTVPFDEQISDLLDILEPKKNILKELLSIPGIEGELFLGFSSECGQGGAYFSPLLLTRISTLSLALNLDLYPPPSTEEQTIET